MCSDILNIVKLPLKRSRVYERSLGYPDAGALALGVIFTEIAGSLK